MFNNIFKTAFAALLLTISWCSYAFITVGDEFDGCDFNDLTSAITQAITDGDDEIRITMDFTQGYAGTLTQSMTFLGGYQSCNDALNNNPRGNNKSNWVPAVANSTVIKIKDETASNVPFLIVIDGFNVFNGSNNAQGQVGGIKIEGTPVAGFQSVVRIMNSEIYNNSGDTGGGIKFSGSRTVLYVQNTKIHDNQSVAGGGIYCFDQGVSVVSEQSAINANTASSTGGGIYLSEGCELTLNSGDLLAEGQMQEGIFSNFADIGGGVYAIAASIKLFGRVDNPASVSGNKALTNENSSGGGIKLDTGSSLVGHNVRIDLNEANYAGGIVAFHAYVNINSLPQPCFGGSQYCSSISGNKAINNGFGDYSVLYSLASTVTIDGTNISNNRSSMSLFKLRVGGDVTISNSLIADNITLNTSGLNNLPVYPIFHIKNGNVSLDFTYNTLVNNVASGVFKLSNNNNITGHQINIGNSIIWQPLTYIVDTSSSAAANAVQIDCLMFANLNGVSELSGFNVGWISELNPHFRNAVNGDYHLADNSPAIDFCDNSFLPQNNDLDHKQRGEDDLGFPNLHGTYDLGAYEYAPQTDLIFKNNFE